jgi:hypothetical protein
LADFLVDPGVLEGLPQWVVEAFNSRDFSATHSGNRKSARVHDFSIDEDPARAAGLNPAPKFDSGEAQVLTQHPKQGFVGIGFEIESGSIAPNREPHTPPVLTQKGLSRHLLISHEAILGEGRGFGQVSVRVEIACPPSILERLEIAVLLAIGAVN